MNGIISISEHDINYIFAACETILASKDAILTQALREKAENKYYHTGGLYASLMFKYARLLESKIEKNVILEIKGVVNFLLEYQTDKDIKLDFSVQDDNKVKITMKKKDKEIGGVWEQEAEENGTYATILYKKNIKENYLSHLLSQMVKFLNN